MKPLTIEQFDVSDSFILDPARGKYRLTFAKLVSIEMDKCLSPIRIDGDLKVFMKENDGKRSFSLAIATDETKEKFFEKLDDSLSRLASTVLPRTKPEDFVLIKENKNYRNVYCKIYMNPSSRPKYLYSALIDGKRRVKSLEDSVFEKFKGSCIVQIIHAFSHKTKGISICTYEIINYDSQECHLVVRFYS